MTSASSMSKNNDNLTSLGAAAVPPSPLEPSGAQSVSYSTGGVAHRGGGGPSSSTIELGFKLRAGPGAPIANLGKSCFLGSVLQALFHVTAFHNFLLSHIEGCPIGARGV